MDRIIISSNEVFGNGPHEGSRVRDAGCGGTLVSQNIKQIKPSTLVSEIRVYPKAGKLASGLTSNRPDLAQIVLFSFSQNKGNRGTRCWAPGVETVSNQPVADETGGLFLTHQVMVVKVPAFSVPPSGDDMGFVFPLMALPVVAGPLDDVMVDWAETRDVRAEKAKKRVEVKRILTIDLVEGV